MRRIDVARRPLVPIVVVLGLVMRYAERHGWIGSAPLRHVKRLRAEPQGRAAHARRGQPAPRPRRGHVASAARDSYPHERAKVKCWRFAGRMLTYRGVGSRSAARPRLGPPRLLPGRGAGGPNRSVAAGAAADAPVERKEPQVVVLNECPGRDSNPHGFRQSILSQANPITGSKPPPSPAFGSIR